MPNANIESKLQEAAEQFTFLIHPAEGSVSWYNDTDKYVEVQTFDEKDAVRWIAYESRKIAPKQGVQLTARGQMIHVKVVNNGATYDCQKGKTYLFDGQNTHQRPEEA